MKSKILFGAFIILIIFLAWSITGAFGKKDNGKLINSDATTANAFTTPTAAPTPIEYHFDRSTDLKKELETVTPQVQESDFSALN
jgi:hypothetical protein